MKKIKDELDEFAVNESREINLDKLESFRDDAFVIIGNTLDFGEDHSEIISEILGDDDIADEYVAARFGYENEAELPFAAGYCYNRKVIIITESLQNLSMSTVMSKLKEHGYTEFFTAPADIYGAGFVKRIAKK